MTCKDCMHNKVCNKDKIMNHTISKSVCKHFKDKSLYVKLPCNIGDSVWIINELHYNSKPHFDTIQRITIYQKDVAISFHCLERVFTQDEIGRTVFFTKEEAEQALIDRATN